MELLEVLITPSQTVTVPAGYYGNCSVPTTADTEINETFTLLWNGFGYWNNQ
jgi:hypothetical protein